MTDEWVYCDRTPRAGRGDGRDTPQAAVTLCATVPTRYAPSPAVCRMTSVVSHCSLNTRLTPRLQSTCCRSQTTSSCAQTTVILYPVSARWAALTCCCSVGVPKTPTLNLGLLVQLAHRLSVRAADALRFEQKVSYVCRCFSRHA